LRQSVSNSKPYSRRYKRLKIIFFEKNSTHIAMHVSPTFDRVSLGNGALDSSFEHLERRAPCRRVVCFNRRVNRSQTDRVIKDLSERDQFANGVKYTILYARSNGRRVRARISSEGGARTSRNANGCQSFSWARRRPRARVCPTRSREEIESRITFSAHA